MFEFIESSVASERLSAALEFVSSFEPGTEVFVVSATREAADDLARAVPAQATFGLHRFSLQQLAASLATRSLAERGLAPATALASEAIAARAIFEALRTSGLSTFEPVARFPGFARSLARTLSELRLAGVGVESIRALEGPGADLARLLELFEELLGANGIVDRAAVLEMAASAWRNGTTALPRTPPVLLLDLELASPLEVALVGAVVGSTQRALATVPLGDGRTLEAMERLGARRAQSGARVELGASSLERLRANLFLDDAPKPAEADSSVRFFSAPEKLQKRRTTSAVRRGAIVCGARAGSAGAEVCSQDVRSGLMRRSSSVTRVE